MLLESKDVQLTLLNELLVQKAYTVSFLNNPHVVSHSITPFTCLG